MSEGTGHDAQCRKCGGTTRWTGTNPCASPRCQWCGSVDVVAWCTDHDPARRVIPAGHVGSEVVWVHG